MKVFYIFSTCCCLLFNLCRAQSNAITAAQWLSYKDTAFRFTMQYPGNWIFKTPGTNVRFFVTTNKENEADDFQENINCITRKLEQKDFSIRSAEGSIKETLAKKMKDYKLLHSGYTKWNNVDAFYVDYTCTNTTESKTVALRLYQFMAVIKGTLYTVTYTAKQNDYDKYMAVVTKVIQLFKVY